MNKNEALTNTLPKAVEEKYNVVGLEDFPTSKRIKVRVGTRYQLIDFEKVTVAKVKRLIKKGCKYFAEKSKKKSTAVTTT